MSTKFEWHELIDRHLHGELDEAEKERLAEWLDSDPAARKAFVEQVQWDTRFSEALRERSGSMRDPMTKQIADLISVEQTTTRRERRPMRILTRSLLAAAAVVVGLEFHMKLIEPCLARVIVSHGDIVGPRSDAELFDPEIVLIPAVIV